MYNSLGRGNVTFCLPGEGKKAKVQILRDAPGGGGGEGELSAEPRGK